MLYSSGGGTASSPSPSSLSSTSSRPIRKSRLRRQPKKPVPTHLLPFHENRLLLTMSIACCFLCFSIVPIWILESMKDPEHHPRAVHGVHQLMNIAQQIRSKVSSTTEEQAKNIIRHNVLPQDTGHHGVIDNSQRNQDVAQAQNEPVPDHDGASIPKAEESARDGEKRSSKKKKKKKEKPRGPPSLVEQQAKPQFQLSDLQGDENDDWIHKSVDRGVAGRPSAPAMEGAQRAHIANCEINVDSLAYWNDPVGTRDLHYQSPFTSKSEQEQFITFSPDSGGWNNIRMSMEILFVLASVTGRTLVLPPKAPMYLLNKDKAAKHRGFGDFFPLDHPNFPVRIISMEEYLKNNYEQQEQLKEERWAISSDRILNASVACEKRKASDNFCGTLYEYLETVGYNPKISSEDCLIFDTEAAQGHVPSEEAEEVARTYCGKRRVVYWNDEDHAKHDHLHFPANTREYRLLTHFYNMMYFADSAVGNFYKRFVRDYLHYNDLIYCAAGKIVKAVQAEGMQRGFSLDSEKGGAYSAMHIRRGDLQYKKVKIPAKEWYDNTKEVWLDKELLYIATDERNKTFFDDLARHYELRFLDDYWDLAGLSNLDPNYMGMIDTIVASRGRAFAGTWFSTFSGYINRLRGYHGMSMKDSWYSYLPKKTAVHDWRIVTHYAYAFEYPDAWVGIDADVVPERDKF